MDSSAREAETLASEQAQLTALLDLAKRIAALTPPERLLELIADAAARLFGFESGGFRLLEGEELVAAGQWGDEGMRRPRLRVGESLSGRVAASGEILVVHDVQRDPRLDPLHREAAQRFGYQTYVGVPLRLGTRVIGVLVLRSRRHRALAPGDLAVLGAFADHAAIALQNARLYETAQRQRRQAEALTEIARDVSSALDRDTVLQRVVEHARQLCQADGVSLALSEGDGAHASVVAQTGYATEAYRRLRLQRGEGVVGEVLATRRSVSTPDRLGDARWPADEVARAEGLRAVAAVPVLAGDALLGVLLVHRRAPNPFGATDVATVEALARHAAVAIQNASLYQAARAQAAERQQTVEELRASQDRLVQTERLRALGEMASGVAHDFNNLLAVILGRAQLLKLRTEDERVRQGLSVIEGAAMDAAQRVRRIQEFTRIRQARPYELVDLAQAIREAVELTRGRWHDEAQVRGVRYAIELDLPRVPYVVGDGGDLREVFTNLLLNALDAMPDGGRISVGLAAGPGEVVARVRDTGPGIPADLQQRVFEPFFTTRGPRQHGLGLSVAYGIVQRHRGTIEVEAGGAQGTTFAVALPVASVAKGAASPGGEAPRSAAGRPARVFVVEDEPSVREVVVDLLRSAGHEPVAAGDGSTGLALLERGAPPDVALIDFGLPGMSGLEVATRLRASYPGLPLVLVTGWADRLDPATVERSGISRVIAKPFQADEVLRVVAETMRRQAPAR